MVNAGNKPVEIARALGRARSTISREIARNTSRKTAYSAATSQENYKHRRKRCRRNLRLDDPAVLEKVKSLLNLYWSPEQISVRLFVENHPIQVSASTIYRGFASGKLGAKLRKKLRRRGRRKKGYVGSGVMPISQSIHERPEAVDNRERIGDWECDTIHGLRHKGSVATMVDRKSRYTLLAKLRNITAAEYTQAVTDVFRRLAASKVLTITCDQGKEFAEHKILAQALSCTVYFADPGCPGQRGTNENTNGLLRQFLPKRKDFTVFSQDDLEAFAELLNRRPRKCLGWLSPYEVFSDTLLHLT